MGGRREREIKFFLTKRFSKIYLFIFGCAGSSLLCGLFGSWGEWGLLSRCGARASDCAGFFGSGAQAPGC